MTLVAKKHPPARSKERVYIWSIGQTANCRIAEFGHKINSFYERVANINSNHIHATGETVPTSGIYRVYHNEHRVPSEVILIGGDQFPRCSKCDISLAFVLVRKARTGFEYHPVHLYELPDLDDEEKESEAEAAG